jgi:hypothetical protein
MEYDEFQELRQVIETVWKWFNYDIDPSVRSVTVNCYDGDGDLPVRSITLQCAGAAQEARELDASYWRLD